MPDAGTADDRVSIRNFAFDVVTWFVYSAVAKVFCIIVVIVVVNNNNLTVVVVHYLQQLH